MSRFGGGLTTAGFDQLERNLRALGTTQATKIGNSATRKGAKHMEAALRSAAPVGPRADGTAVGQRTHAKISSNIKVKKGRSKAGPQSIVYVVHTGNAFHSIFVERGTIHQPAQPKFGRAFGSAAQGALNIIVNDLQRGIAAAARP